MSGYQDPLFSGFGNPGQVNAPAPTSKGKELRLVTIEIKRGDGQWYGSITAGKSGFMTKKSKKMLNPAPTIDAFVDQALFYTKKGFKLVPGDAQYQPSSVQRRDYSPPAQPQQPPYQQQAPPQQVWEQPQQQRVWAYSGNQVANQPPQQYQPVPQQYQQPPPNTVYVPTVNEAPRAPVVAQQPAQITTRVCKACGSIVPETQRFCGICGAKYEVPPPPPPAPVSKGFCGECGTPITSRFCTSCGAKV